jgi:parvulin-like peptidyl-prolyl isomerase
MAQPLKVMSIIFAGLLVGCQPSGEGFSPSSSAATQPGGPREAGAGDRTNAERPLAYVAGQAVYPQEVLGALLESAGGQILAEVVLDRLIAARLGERGMALSEADIQAEKARLMSSLSQDEDQAVLLLRELRSRRGLGEQRFEQFLRRNAGLRKLVQDEIAVTPAAVRRAYAIEYGPRYEARIIVVPTLAQAAQVRQLAIQRPQAFGELAATHSRDSSAGSGGWLGAISAEDPVYPQALRTALEAMEQGEISSVVAVDGGFAVLALERKIAGEKVEFDDVQESLSEQVRRQSERLATQRLVRAMLAEAKVVVLDPALSESWKQQKDLLIESQ